jgi:hypothetical protein
MVLEGKGSGAGVCTEVLVRLADSPRSKARGFAVFAASCRLSVLTTADTPVLNSPVDVELAFSRGFLF